MDLPRNFCSLHAQEELLRERAVELCIGENDIDLHLRMIETAMNACDMLRQYETDSEDLKVVQMLALRVFNALGASLKLVFSGYFQNSALIVRDVIETTFLLDLFQSDHSQIAIWRTVTDGERRKSFSPASVRKLLDKRDNNSTRSREELYRLFSDLAGHPNMKSIYMLRPAQNSNAVLGPFMEKVTLHAVLSEMGKVSIQSLVHLIPFFPQNWSPSFGVISNARYIIESWMNTFTNRLDL